MERIQERLNEYPFLHTIEAVTGVPKPYIALVIIIAAFCMVFFGWGMRLFYRIVGFFWPLFQSFKCIEDHKPDDMRLWLTYWLVFGFFTLTANIFDTALSWIPFYYPAKLGFLVWCFHPQHQGAITIFDKFIRPLLERNVKQLEGSFEEMYEAATSLVKSTTTTVSSKGLTVSQKVISEGSKWVDDRRQRLVESPETQKVVESPQTKPTSSGKD